MKAEFWVKLFFFFFFLRSLKVLISLFVWNYISKTPWSLGISVSCSVVSDSFWPYGPYPSRLLCPWNFPGENTGVGCHSHLQGIFPTQGSNLGLPHCRQILNHLSYQGSMISGKSIKICLILTHWYLPRTWKGISYQLISEQAGTTRLKRSISRSGGIFGCEGQQLGSGRVERTQLGHWPSLLNLSWGHCTSETCLGVGGPGEQASAALLRWYVSSLGNKQAMGLSICEIAWRKTERNMWGW